MIQAADTALWLHELDLRRAERTVPVPGGVAVLHDAFPDAHDHNKLSVVAAADGAALAAAADEVLGGARRTHRLVEIRGPDPADFSGALAAHGYTREDSVVLTYAGSDGPARATVPVEVLSLEQRVVAAERSWRRSLPEAGPDVWQQLGERITTVLDAADTTFLGVLGEEGAVIARADVYLHAGVAQIEEVITDEDRRGQGIGTAMVGEAIRRARGAGAATVFLVADADGPARRLYERLGFRPTALLAAFTRIGSAGG